MLNEVRKSLYEKRDKSFSLTGIIVNIALFLIALVFAVEIFFNMTYTGIYVVNVSMTPTLNGATVIDLTTNPPKVGTNGDYIYIRTGAKPKRGDIVVVKQLESAGGDKYIIKRALAFAGEKVEFIEGWLYIDGEKQEESYISDEYRTNSFSEYYNYPHEGEHIVEENGVFLLGDNRNNSDDSRKYGDYPLANVLGVVPAWAVKYKAFTTAVHAFFYFKLRGKTTA